MGYGVEEDEGLRPFGVRRRVERGHGAAVLRRQQDRARRADGVQDGAHVVHASLESREMAAEVGEARATLVEKDQPERLR